MSAHLQPVELNSPPTTPGGVGGGKPELMVRVVTTHDDEDEYVVGGRGDIQRAGDEEEGRPFPFRMVGVVFLLVAVIVAIVLAAVPAALHGADNADNREIGVVAKALIGLFLLFLFSCLFFTYYLGGSKETWEDPVFTELHITFSNVTAVTGLFLEFIQVCSFSLNYKATFMGSENLGKIQYLALPYKNGHVFEIMYWIMFVIAFSPYIFIVTVRMIIYTINRRKGEAEAAVFVQAYQQKIYSILWILVNTIYIPVIGTMLAGIDCTYTTPDASNSISESDNYMDQDPKHTCFSRKHVKYVICTLIALVIYYPAASFAQAQTQNISDIKFKPKIVFVFVQGKVLLVCADIFFTTLTTPYLCFVLLVDLVFLCVNIWKSPCLVQWVNQLRTIFFVLALVTVVASLISVGDGVKDRAPLIFLIIGWVVAGIGLPVFFVVWHRLKKSV